MSVIDGAPIRCERPGRAGPTTGAPRPYGKVDLLRLVIRIVRYGDGDALRELHDHRTPLRLPNGRDVRISEYVELLKNGGVAHSWCGAETSILEHAYDLTIDRLSHLRSCTHGKDPGPDCRVYFRAFLKHFRLRRRASNTRSSLQTELLAASVLQGLIIRHFEFSCLDAWRRSNGFARRFVWSCRDRRMCLRFPAGMTSRQCRAWLESNVTFDHRVTPPAVGSVQAIIDERLFAPRLTARRNACPVIPRTTASVRPQSVVDCDEPSKSLAHSIAEEKAEAIDSQRPAIRALGKPVLKALVLRVFEDVASGEYRPSIVARIFGLSRAAMTRFAGARWSTRAQIGRARVPDLWRNMAQILAANEEFVEAAISAGVWNRVASIARPCAGRRR